MKRAASLIGVITALVTSTVGSTATGATRAGRTESSAQVIVSKIGFAQDKTTSSSSIIYYGVLLMNTSRSMDALKLTVTVRAVDKRGRSIATDEMPVTGIPAGGRFNLAGLLTPGVSLTVTKLRATIKVGQRKSRALRLPRVSNVRLHPGGQLVDVTGRLTNPYRKPLSEDATIYAIFLNRSGRIVAADSTTIGARVQPGATVSFDVEGVVNDPTAKPVSAQVSIDPCSDLDVLSHACVALSR